MMPGPFGFLFTNTLLNEVLCCADGIRRATNSYPAVASARSVDALFRDLNIGTAKVLDLQQGLATRTKDRPDNVLTDLQFSSASKRNCRQCFN